MAAMNGSEQEKGMIWEGQTKVPLDLVLAPDFHNNKTKTS
jgi:hypothetical protein